MGKRTRGNGALYHRPDGRWEGQIRIRGGRRRSFYARTRREVIRWLTEARWALGQGLPVSTGTTSLATFFDRWLAVTRTRLAAHHHAGVGDRRQTADTISRSYSALRPYARHDRVDVCVSLAIWAV